MWSDYGLFVLKSLTLLIVLLIFMVAAVRTSRTASSPNKGKLSVRKINEKWHQQAEVIRHKILNRKALKAQIKATKIKAKTEPQEKPRVWLLHFKGDMQASQVDSLRIEVNAILQVAETEEEVVVTIESPGGAVSGYGLAASQLLRLRDAGLNLTVCVDKVAASGGYMMACTAHTIIAAPFAVVGSIGVLAQIPNIHRFLQRFDVDVDVLTAGKHKAPLTLLGERTEEGRDKLLVDLQSIHSRFKELVTRFRPDLDVAAVTEGDFWLAEDALALKLVDQLATSDAYLTELAKDKEIIEVQWQPKKSLNHRLKLAASASFDGMIERLSQRFIP